MPNQGAPRTPPRPPRGRSSVPPAKLAPPRPPSSVVPAERPRGAGTRNTADGGAARPDATAGAGRAAESPFPPRRAPATTPLSVLLVEDDESVRLTLEGVLEMDGHRITTAATVDEALARLADGGYQAVISDFQLNDDAGRTGLQVLAEAARRVPGSTTILVTGYPSAKLMESARSQAVSTVLIKPYPLEDLKAALARG